MSDNKRQSSLIGYYNDAYLPGEMAQAKRSAHATSPIIRFGKRSPYSTDTIQLTRQLRTVRTSHGDTQPFWVVGEETFATNLAHFIGSSPASEWKAHPWWNFNTRRVKHVNVRRCASTAALVIALHGFSQTLFSLIYPLRGRAEKKVRTNFGVQSRGVTEFREGERTVSLLLRIRMCTNQRCNENNFFLSKIENKNQKKF